MLKILEIWLTPSGAAIIFLLVLLILFLCAFFFPSAQALIRQFLEKGVRGKWGSGEIELGRPILSKPADDLPAGEVAPTPSKDTESCELQNLEARAITIEGDDPNRENALHADMLIATFSRNHEAFARAFKALENLPDRKESDESLISTKLSLEHRMGDDSAVGKLARLVDDRPDWYEPCQFLASIYYNLDSYDNASVYLVEAQKRAQDDAQRLRSLLLEGSIRVETEGLSAAIKLLKTSVAEFPKLRHRARIWNRLAEMQWDGGEKIAAFLAAEIALQIEPLERQARFELAYKYADGGSTKLLGYFYYDKLREQDERYPSCLNNMAIILEGLDMTCSYVNLLKRAKEFDQPYPHGNLAIGLAKAGFLDEARAMIEELPEQYRLDSRAAEAAEFIAQKQRKEAKTKEKLERASELFHKTYLTAALNVRRGVVVGVASAVGKWTSSSCDLSLEGGAEPESLVGTLEKGGSKYDIKMRCVDNVLSGEATSNGSGLSILSITMTYKLLLAFENEGKLVGLIYMDEMTPGEVTLMRQG